jgi:hypothetical protein
VLGADSVGVVTGGFEAVTGVKFGAVVVDAGPAVRDSPVLRPVAFADVAVSVPGADCVARAGTVGGVSTGATPGTNAALAAGAGVGPDADVRSGPSFDGVAGTSVAEPSDDGATTVMTKFDPGAGRLAGALSDGRAAPTIVPNPATGSMRTNAPVCGSSIM